MKSFEQQSYYELLEIQASATEEQILDAYARAMETYAPDSIAVYTLADPGQLETLRQRLTLAMETLSEMDKRLEYDRSIGVKRSEEELALLRAESLKRAAGADPEPKPTSGGGEAPVAVAPEPVPVVEAKPPEIETKPVVEEEPIEAVEVVAEVEPEVAQTRAAEPPPVAPAQPAVAVPIAPARTPLPGTHRPAAHSRSIPLVSRPGSPVPPPLPARSALRAPVHAAAEAAARQRLAAEAAATAAAAPPPSESEKGKPPSRPSTGQQLGEAPVLAQAAAIATAESALAQVAVKARESRTRLKTVVDVPSDAEFNGELLRRIREGRSLSLQMLADRTRISSRHVEAIEADRYASLPAAVYLRGMLMSIARELGLDPLRVSRSYMALVSEGEKKRR